MAEYLSKDIKHFDIYYMKSVFSDIIFNWILYNLHEKYHRFLFRRVCVYVCVYKIYAKVLQNFLNPVLH